MIMWRWCRYVVLWAAITYVALAPIALVLSHALLLLLLPPSLLGSLLFPLVCIDLENHATHQAQDGANNRYDDANQSRNTQQTERGCSAPRRRRASRLGRLAIKKTQTKSRTCRTPIQ